MNRGGKQCPCLKDEPGVGPARCSRNLAAYSKLAIVVDDGAVAGIGAVIVGFSITAFVFRIQRELQMADEGQRRWIPWADRPLISVVTVTLLLVLFPIALAGNTSILWGERLPAATCCASTVALAGYIPALLTHYRFGPSPVRKWIWFECRLGDRSAGEPAEIVIVVASAVLGIMAAVISLAVTG